MTRMPFAIAAVLLAAASTVHAQNTHFTVSAASASVYKAPTNVSPVIGEAKQGATLEVTRDVDQQSAPRKTWLIVDLNSREEVSVAIGVE